MLYLHDIHPHSNAYNILAAQLSARVDATRTDVQQLLARAVPRAAEEDDGDIPLHPQRQNYELIQHWEAGLYNQLRHTKKKGKSKASTPDGADLDDPITSLFMEDQNGVVISPSRRRKLKTDARVFWQSKYNKGEPLNNFKNIDLGHRDDFRAFMEKAHPWLRLCENHWKVDQIWIDNFSQWKPATPLKDGVKKEVTVKRGRSESIEDDQLEDDQPGPSLKKSKAMATEKPAVPRPKPKHTKSIVKVSTLLLSQYYTDTKYIQMNPL
jgi:hypothetical protein